MASLCGAEKVKGGGCGGPCGGRMAKGRLEAERYRKSRPSKKARKGLVVDGDPMGCVSGKNADEKEKNKIDARKKHFCVGSKRLGPKKALSRGALEWKKDFVPSKSVGRGETGLVHEKVCTRTET